MKVLYKKDQKGTWLESKTVPATVCFLVLIKIF